MGGPAADGSSHAKRSRLGLVVGTLFIFPDRIGSGEVISVVGNLDSDVLGSRNNMGNDELDALGRHVASEVGVVTGREGTVRRGLIQAAQVVGSSAAVRACDSRGSVRQRGYVVACTSTANQGWQTGGAAMSVGSAEQHGLFAAVELREVVPGVRRCQGGGGAVSEYYWLPFGGVKICLGIMHVAEYPDC